MSYLPEKYSTSFMDVILGTLGAFFLLLIIISTNRRGEQQQGSQLPGNVISFKILNATETDANNPSSANNKNHYLSFFTDIGFWVGIVDADNNLEAVWYSDETKDGNINCKDRIDINITNRDVSSEFATILGVSDEDLNNDRVIIGLWLRELPSAFTEDKKSILLDQNKGIQIEVILNKKATIVKLLITNNFEAAIQPMSRGNAVERNDLLEQLKVTCQKPKGYGSFHHANKNQFSDFDKGLRLDFGADLRFTYNQPGANLNRLAKLYLNVKNIDKYAPVYFSRQSSGFSFDNDQSVVEISYRFISSNEQQINPSYNDFINHDEYSKIKSVHAGVRAVAIVMDDFIKYHLIDPINSKAKTTEKEKNNALIKYPYYSWKKIYPSPGDGENAKWETITAEEIKWLQGKYPDLGDDFIYAFAEYLAEPLPDQGTDDEPLPFRRNPMLDLWLNTSVPQTPAPSASN